MGSSRELRGGGARHQEEPPGADRGGARDRRALRAVHELFLHLAASVTHGGLTAAVLTVSDGVAAGRRADASGAVAQELLEGAGFGPIERISVPDDVDAISKSIRDLAGRARLVVTTGGTGFGPRDVTP